MGYCEDEKRGYTLKVNSTNLMQSEYTVISVHESYGGFIFNLRDFFCYLFHFFFK